jgi:hypothetical protein
MVDQLVEAVAHEPARHGLLQAGLLELQHEALAQVARPDTRGIEALDGREHLVDLFVRVERKVIRVSVDLLGGFDDRVVDGVQEVVEGTGEVAVLVDVADELVGEERLPWRQLEQ